MLCLYHSISFHTLRDCCKWSKLYLLPKGTGSENNENLPDGHLLSPAQIISKYRINSNDFTHMYSTVNA